MEGFLKWIWGAQLYTKADRLGTYAAALAFYFVLSLIPFLVVTATATALISPISLTGKFENILGAVLPMESPADRQMIVNAVSQTSSRGLATFGFVLAVYTSFNFMMQIVRTLLFIFDHQRSPKPSGFRDLIKSFVLLLLWISFLTVICMSFVVIPLIQATIDSLTIVKDLNELPQPRIDIFKIASDVVGSHDPFRSLLPEFSPGGESEIPDARPDPRLLFFDDRLVRFQPALCGGAATCLEF